MMSRIHDMQAYETQVIKIDALVYNLWRRVRLHVDLPARLKLPALKSMELILEKDHWVMVDSRHDDLPMIAWLLFQDVGRSSLHTPVACTVKYYHFMASQFYEKALAEISSAFEDCLV